MLHALSGAAAAALGWGLTEAARPRLRELEVELPSLLPELDGLRIAHLSDFHFGVPSPGIGATWQAAVWVRERKPDLVAVTGDLLTHPRGEPMLRRLMRVLPQPTFAVLGNHDVRGVSDVGGALRAAGIRGSEAAHAVDLPGIRLVMGHSPVIGSHAGRLGSGHLDELVALAGTSSPVAMVMHHPPRRLPVSTVYPPGIVRRDSARLVRGLQEANPSVVMLAGHTHRNRLYRVGGIPVAEVGSTKDFPGQWAGYTVYEGGLRQVVRRTARPDVIAWTEMTGTALGGVWRRWSPGSIGDRCWSVEWAAGGI